MAHSSWRGVASSMNTPGDSRRQRRRLHDIVHARLPRGVSRGAVYYGVSDLEALAKDTHKFENTTLSISSFLSRAPRSVSRAFADQPRRASLCPTIFFQGLEDKVVPPDQTQKWCGIAGQAHSVACVEFTGEAHGFRRADTIKRALEAELYFYSRIFGFTPTDPIEPLEIENL